MRIVAEWYEERGSCCYHQRAEFEGETREEVNEQIRARVGSRDVLVVGLHNDLRDYASYAGEAAEVLGAKYSHGFRDSMEKPGPGAVVPAIRPDTPLLALAKRLFSKHFPSMR